MTVMLSAATLQSFLALLLSFSCDCASHDFVLLSFWQVFDELYLTQIVIKSLVTLTVDVKIYKLDVCKFIEPESVSL